MDDRDIVKFGHCARNFGALLDITRLVSRVGFGRHTGIDRVELAYLRWCLASDSPLFGLVRVRGGYGLLDHNGMQGVYDRITGITPWGKRDLRGLIGLRTSILRARAESDIRRMSIQFNSKPNFENPNLSDLIYLNVGHSNLSHEAQSSISTQVRGVVALLHDVIPLDFPHFQRAETVREFKKKIRTINTNADLIIFSSEAAKGSARQYLDVSRSVVAHLGIDAPENHKSNLQYHRPYFVTIGTIEPRKNHALLLDVWDQMAKDFPQEKIPSLHIVGRRGWNNDKVFNRLDKLSKSTLVVEHNDLSDSDMWSFLKGSNGLLFPSFAEGFGLPSLEAAALGVPVICGDLAIHHEVLGDYPVYLDLQDSCLWREIILEQTQTKAHTVKVKPHISTWNEHFMRINDAITDI